MYPAVLVPSVRHSSIDFQNMHLLIHPSRAVMGIRHWWGASGSAAPAGHQPTSHHWWAAVSAHKQLCPWNIHLPRPTRDSIWRYLLSTWGSAGRVLPALSSSSPEAPACPALTPVPHSSMSFSTAPIVSSVLLNSISPSGDLFFAQLIPTLLSYSQIMVLSALPSLSPPLSSRFSCCASSIYTCLCLNLSPLAQLSHPILMFSTPFFFLQASPFSWASLTKLKIKSVFSFTDQKDVNKKR